MFSQVRIWKFHEMMNLMPLVLLDMSKDDKNIVYKWWFGLKGKILSLYENILEFFLTISSFPIEPKQEYYVN